jgi:hypothetical protein
MPIREVTAPTVFKLVDDRLHVTITSDDETFKFAFKFHRAETDAQLALRALAERKHRPDNVEAFAHRAAKARASRHSD